MNLTTKNWPWGAEEQRGLNWAHDRCLRDRASIFIMGINALGFHNIKSKLIVSYIFSVLLAITDSTLCTHPITSKNIT